jgi:hypothetical protein
MIALEGRTLKAFVISDRDYYPDLQQLQQDLTSDHLEWHVWERAEIENYLLCPPAIERLLRGPERQPVLEEQPFRQEYCRLLEASRDSANDHLVEAFKEYGKRLDKQWDAVTMSRNAREYLNEHWDSDQIGLADAKEVVLPGIKTWLQKHAYGQFSNKALAQTLLRDDLPEEVHELARKLAKFAGVTASSCT